MLFYRWLTTHASDLSERRGCGQTPRPLLGHPLWAAHLPLLRGLVSASRAWILRRSPCTPDEPAPHCTSPVLKPMSVLTPGAVRIGAIGAGGFGLFALQQFLQVPGVQLAAHRRHASRGRAGHGAALRRARCRGGRRAAREPGGRSRLHRHAAFSPLSAGPRRAAGRQACHLRKAARPHRRASRRTRRPSRSARDLLCIANLMQRYNPLFDAVRRLVESRVLGECLHGWFENYASDEGLARGALVLGSREKRRHLHRARRAFLRSLRRLARRGEVVAAQRVLRPGSGIEEQVQCTVRYASGALVNFYHGFTQPSRLDRQEFRLLFERGDLTLEEWVPVRARIRAVVNEEQTRTLMELFPGAQLDVLKTYGGTRPRGARPSQGPRPLPADRTPPRPRRRQDAPLLRTAARALRRSTRLAARPLARAQGHRAQRARFARHGRRRRASRRVVMRQRGD